MEEDYDYSGALTRRLGKIRQMAPAQQMPMQQQSYGNSAPRIGSPPGAQAGGNEFEKFMSAISSQESGNNYKAMGVMVKGDRAHGKYQIMGRNIPSWSRAALGRSISPQEFMRNPQLQEQIARHMLQGYYRKYGPAGAAVAWYSGEGNAKKYVKNNGRGYNTRQNGGRFPSVNQYAQAILRRMGMG